jgi:hypothetical protein
MSVKPHSCHSWDWLKLSKKRGSLQKCWNKLWKEVKFKSWKVHGWTQCSEGEFLVRYQPQSKLITLSYLIRSFFQGTFGQLKFRYELAVKLWIKLLTNSLQTYILKVTKNYKFGVTSTSWQSHHKLIPKLPPHS